MANYTPDSTGSALKVEKWQKEIEPAVYEKAVGFPVAAPRDRLYSKLHIRKLSKFSATAFADSTAPTGLTYTANTEVAVTVTPTAAYIALQISENQLAQMDQSPVPPWRSNVEEGLAAFVDQAFFQLVSTLTTNKFGSNTRDLDAAYITGVMSMLRNAYPGWGPGDPAYMHLGPLQWDNLISIPQISQANLRGDDADPLVKGSLHEGWGLRFVVTGNLQIDGTNTLHNVLWVPSALGISFNEKIKVQVQLIELATRIIAYVSYGTAVVWDERAVDCQTQAA